MKSRIVLPAALALALGSGALALDASAALAQGSNPPTTQQGQSGTQAPHRDPAAQLQHRIDHIKAELKITPAQEPQFDQFAQALRDNAAQRQQAFQQLRANRDQPKTAIDRLETHVQLAQMRVTETQHDLDAFRPLYSSLSADQKQIADKMFAPHFHGHGRHHA